MRHCVWRRGAGGGPAAAPHRAEGHAEDLVEVGRHPRAQRLRPRPPPRTAATAGCGGGGGGVRRGRGRGAAGAGCGGGSWR